MTRTFAFLILTQFRNRLVRMAKRAKKPRYAIGMILGIAYIWFFFLGPMTGQAQGMRAGLFQQDAARAIAPVILMLVLATTWFGGATLNALAFTPAEMSMLFPAPVSRRALILYKLGTAQLPIILNAMILSLIFDRGPAAIPKPLAVVSLWVTFSTLHLHRLGAALVHASTIEHGKSGLKRNWFSHVVSILIFATVMGVFVTIPIEAAGGGRSGGVAGMLAPLTEALSRPLVQAALYPFAIIIAPAFSRSVGEWGYAMISSVLLMALHFLWVMRSQVAFEEAADEASRDRQQLIDAWRKRGTVAKPRAAKSRFGEIGLQPTGHPAVAIIWKNTLAFFRTVRPLQIVATLLMPTIVIGYFGWKKGDPGVAIAGICAIYALVLWMAGGSQVRNDLRSDMLNLTQLKSLPLRGREIVFAEVVSSALPLAVMQLVLLDIALVALQLSKHPFPMGVANSLAVTIPIGLAALNLVNSTLRNATAVLFPSWQKLGAEGAGGFEIIGQQMLTMLALLLGFLLLMVVPALVTLFMTMYVQPPAVVSIVFSVVVASAALGAECYGLIAWLGRVFERTEPSQTA